MVNVKTGQLTLGGQFDAYKRGQLGRNIQIKEDTMNYPHKYFHHNSILLVMKQKVQLPLFFVLL